MLNETGALRLQPLTTGCAALRRAVPLKAYKGRPRPPEPPKAPAPAPAPKDAPPPEAPKPAGPAKGAPAAQ